MKLHGLLITVCILVCVSPTDGWRRRRRRRSPAPAPPADTTPPTFTNCRSHWTVPITTTSTVVTWTEPTATDDRPIRMQGGSGYCHGPPPVCMMPIFDISPTRSGPAPGSTFTEGRHAVTYTAQDLAGNIATCRIEFTVEIIRCPPIPPVSNGVHVCTYGVIGGSQCVFSCHHGYTLSGSATTHCNADTRRWSSPIPTCQVKTCSPPLVAPSHGSVSCSDSNRFMSLCTFYCDEGFEIPSGQSSALFCNGHVWSANPPICQDVKPPEFTACPTSFDVNIQSATSDSALVSYNSPRAVDNSGHVTIRLVEGKASGSRFDSGANTVKYRAEDGAGNIIECNFTINVIIIIVTG
ncbi:sushi-repeat-containing protein SRPX-like [Apostichopus japonicus]|uniref:sushi-repeat-containing protein SRPX-like n=1 Tax=Stichopus japonicus TaxID=307972 RepID=UPI003AB1F216